MTQRKLGCKQTRCAEPLPCSHSLLVQRSDNSLCKMAAGHAFLGEPRRGGAGSQLRGDRTSRMRCAEAFVIPAWCPFAGWPSSVARINWWSSGKFSANFRCLQSGFPWFHGAPPGAQCEPSGARRLLPRLLLPVLGAAPACSSPARCFCTGVQEGEGGCGVMASLGSRRGPDPPAQTRLALR